MTPARVVHTPASRRVLTEHIAGRVDGTCHRAVADFGTMATVGLPRAAGELESELYAGRKQTDALLRRGGSLTVAEIDEQITLLQAHEDAALEREGELVRSERDHIEQVITTRQAFEEENVRLATDNLRLREALRALLDAYMLVVARLQRLEAEHSAAPDPALMEHVEQQAQRASSIIDQTWDDPEPPAPEVDTERVAPGTELETLRLLFPKNPVAARKSGYYLVGAPASDPKSQSLIVRVIRGRLLVKVGGGFTSMENFVRSHGPQASGSRRDSGEEEKDLSAFARQASVKVFGKFDEFKRRSPKPEGGDTVMMTAGLKPHYRSLKTHYRSGPRPDQLHPTHFSKTFEPLALHHVMVGGQHQRLEENTML